MSANLTPLPYNSAVVEFNLQKQRSAWGLMLSNTITGYAVELL